MNNDEKRREGLEEAKRAAGLGISGYVSTNHANCKDQKMRSRREHTEAIVDLMDLRTSEECLLAIAEWLEEEIERSKAEGWSTHNLHYMKDIAAAIRNRN